jgi:hypothetical protein
MMALTDQIRYCLAVFQVYFGAGNPEIDNSFHLTGVLLSINRKIN